MFPLILLTITLSFNNVDPFAVVLLKNVSVCIVSIKLLQPLKGYSPYSILEFKISSLS